LTPSQGSLGKTYTIHQQVRQLIIGVGPDSEARTDVWRVANLMLKRYGRTERYRLLDTTRAYALEKLAQSDELDALTGLGCNRAFAMANAPLSAQSATPWDAR
jgi:hypothetical protein